jgi:hypothetical protein
LKHRPEKAEEKFMKHIEYAANIEERSSQVPDHVRAAVDAANAELRDTKEVVERPVKSRRVLHYNVGQRFS